MASIRRSKRGLGTRRISTGAGAHLGSYRNVKYFTRILSQETKSKKGGRRSKSRKTHGNPGKNDFSTILLYGGILLGGFLLWKNYSSSLLSTNPVGCPPGFYSSSDLTGNPACLNTGSVQASYEGY